MNRWFDYTLRQNPDGTWYIRCVELWSGGTGKTAIGAIINMLYHYIIGKIRSYL